MKLNARHTKFYQDLERFKETYPDVAMWDGHSETTDVFRVNFININCYLIFPVDWPFRQPSIKMYDEITVIIDQWNPSIDLRSIYNFILNDEFYSQILDLKQNYNEIEITYDHNTFNIIYKNLAIIISKNEIIVYEDEQDWPSRMLPSLDNFNLTNIFKYIIDMREQPVDKDYINNLEFSLKSKFKNVVYNTEHKTFIIDDPKGLILVGIPEKDYLVPNIMIFRQGIILPASFNFDQNWKSNLGEIISTGKGF